MHNSIRPATVNDVAQMVALSEQKRIQYERYEPTFWRKAADSAEKQTPYFELQVQDPKVIALVHEGNAGIDGFVMGTIHGAPPVYDPGGAGCTIDDFMVCDPGLWTTVGRSLLRALVAEARTQGVIMAIVICGHLDEPKRTMLEAEGYPVVTEFHIRRIDNETAPRTPNNPA